jgi:CDP-glucose 4,6-dehydratase
MENLVMRQDIRKFYEGKKVLVTGHTGFKGTWLTAMLKTLGAKVKGYALAPEDSKPFYDLFIPHNLTESVIADIRDKERLKTEIIVFQPDFIFHLAAQPLVLRSYAIPAETFEVNVVGTANILEVAKGLKKKCSIIVVTTDKVYENKEQDILYKETDRLGGHDPYSASKACTEMVVSSFRNSFFNVNEWEVHQKAIATVRAGNVIGGGDWSKDRIIPDTARFLLNNETIKVRNPNAVRPWQHVLEPLSGYLILGYYLHNHAMSFSEPFNFGPVPEDHLTVKELVELAIQVWGKGKMEVNTVNDQPHEAHTLKLDIQKAITKLNWLPKLNAREAVEWTIQWYKTTRTEQAAFTFKQIDNYLGK